MHIPENYISPSTCATMVVAMAPVWALSVKKIKIQFEEKKETLTQIGLGASLSFLIMMFNIPVPGGTTAHAVGSSILAILLGPWAACLAVSLALIVQAFLFGDGGILCIGANCFNMAFVLPFVAYGIFRLCQKINRRYGDQIGAFLGGYFGLIAAATCCAIELGLQPSLFHNASGPLYCPYPLQISLPAMVGVHLLIGLVEGSLCLLVYRYIKKVAPQTLYTAPTKEVSMKQEKHWQKAFIIIVGVALLLCPLGLLASAPAWGEWDQADILAQLQRYHLPVHLPKALQKEGSYHALFDGYALPGWDVGAKAALGYILCGLTAILVFLLLVKLATVLLHKEDKSHERN